MTAPLVDIRVSSWSELQDRLFEDAWNPDIQRYRSRYAFRGLSDADYRLETTLMRLGGAYASLERHLLRNFRKYAHRDVVGGESVWHLISVAQHYGLPTRLLDWTYSPFFAMHFATANIDRFDRDGVIWAVNYVAAHQCLPERLSRCLETEGANVFTTDLLSEAIDSLGALPDLTPESYAVFFEPPSLDDRIVNQYALFSLMSQVDRVMDDWLGDHPQTCRRIVIPAALKWEIRDKLDQAGITERVLFPGLDGLSRWLKRHYSPRRTGPVSGDEY